MITRRGMLAACAALPAWAAPKPVTAGQSAVQTGEGTQPSPRGNEQLRVPQKKVTVGAHLWLYASRQPGYNPAPVIEEIFASLGSAGLDAIELMHQCVLEEACFEKLPALAQRYGLPVIGTSWSANTWNRAEHAQILAEGRVLAGRLGKLKARVLGMSVGSTKQKKTAAELDAQGEMVTKLIRMFADHGVTLNLHNHTYEVTDGEWDLKGTLERVPHAKLGPDIGWLVRAKVDPLDFIRRRRERIVYFHLRNETADRQWPEDLTEGVIDYAAIGRLLHEIGFAGDMAIELAHERGYTPARSDGENFRRSREYVQRVMKY